MPDATFAQKLGRLGCVEWIATGGAGWPYEIAPKRQGHGGGGKERHAVLPNTPSTRVKVTFALWRTNVYFMAIPWQIRPK